MKVPFEMLLFQPMPEGFETHLAITTLGKGEVVPVDDGVIWGENFSGNHLTMTGQEVAQFVRMREEAQQPTLIYAPVKVGEVDDSRPSVVNGPDVLIWTGTYQRPRFATIPDADAAHGLRVFTEVLTAGSASDRSLKIAGQEAHFYEVEPYGVLQGFIGVSDKAMPSKRIGHLGLRFVPQPDDVIDPSFYV